MKNLTFTVLFLFFLLKINAQPLKIQLTDEDDIIISNSMFHGRLNDSIDINIDNCNPGSPWGEFLFLQYDSSNTKDFLVTHPYGVNMVSNFISDGTGFSKIAITNQGGFLFSDGTVNNANMNIGRYNHNDGSILPLLAPQSNTKMPIFRNSYLIDFPNGDWGIVGTYYYGDFFFAGMSTPFSADNVTTKTFVLRFDGTTNQVIWQLDMPFYSHYEPFVTSNGDIYITDYRIASDTMTLGNLSLMPSSISSNYNFFIAKIDAQGNPIVLKDLIETDETSYPSQKRQLLVQDSIYYIISKFYGQTTFDANTTLTGKYNFIAKYHASNDSLLWVKDMQIEIKGSALDFQSNLYLSGFINAQDASWTLDSVNYYNEHQFIIIMDEAGNVTTISTIPNLVSGRFYGYPNNMFVTNSQGKVYGLLGSMEYLDSLLFFEVDSIGQITYINNFYYGTCWISTEEENSTASIKIAPNPATDFINIIIEDDNTVEGLFYKLYNTNGQLLKTKKINHPTIQVDIQDLPSGLFFIEIITPNGSVTKKVVKL